MCCHPARAKPKLLIVPKNQIGNFPVDDVALRIPTDIATTKRCFSCFAVKRKNPLLTVSIFKITDVTIGFIARNYRRITTRSGMMISDFQQGLRHFQVVSIVRMFEGKNQPRGEQPRGDPCMLSDRILATLARRENAKALRQPSHIQKNVNQNIEMNANNLGAIHVCFQIEF